MVCLCSVLSGKSVGESGLKHFNTVLNSAMKAANKYERAICVMYDLSGMRPGDEDVLLKDIADVAKTSFSERSCQKSLLSVS